MVGARASRNLAPAGVGASCWAAAYSCSSSSGAWATSPGSPRAGHVGSEVEQHRVTSHTVAAGQVDPPVHLDAVGDGDDGLGAAHRGADEHDRARRRARRGRGRRPARPGPRAGSPRRPSHSAPRRSRTGRSRPTTGRRRPPRARTGPSRTGRAARSGGAARARCRSGTGGHEVGRRQRHPVAGQDGDGGVGVGRACTDVAVVGDRHRVGVPRVRVVRTAPSEASSEPPEQPASTALTASRAPHPSAAPLLRTATR